MRHRTEEESMAAPGARTFGSQAGSQSMTEFCEQVDPRVLLEMRRTRPFPDMLRVQESWVAAAEKRALLGLGDSLDGTLARVRQRQRPRYGFYVDHMVDSFGALALMGGLALSGYMHPWIAIGLLVAFLMLSIQSYLATHALGEFRISFWRFGPTELRIQRG